MRKHEIQGIKIVKSVVKLFYVVEYVSKHVYDSSIFIVCVNFTVM